MSFQTKEIPESCIVTGGNGVVGQRLIEMLLERGCQRIISFDIASPIVSTSSPYYSPAIADRRVTFIQGDLSKYEDLEKCIPQASRPIECIFHIAALVGPYHATENFMKVNYFGSLNVLKLAKTHEIKKIVMSSSPSTRFPYPDPNIDGLTEDDLFRVNGGDYPRAFHQPYAESKALGEKAILDACCCCSNKSDNRNRHTEEDGLLTVAVAPHQIYGPRDRLFLPNLLAASAGSAGLLSLRIFGTGTNKISMCHVDNYCHGLILGYRALYRGSVALGKFYVITDDNCVFFWKTLNSAVVGMGFPSLEKKWHIPLRFIIGLAYVCYYLGQLVSLFTGVPFYQIDAKVKLNPFTMKMLTIDRYFKIDNAKKDLGYQPVVEFEKGWIETVEWFRVHWLPEFETKNRKMT
jgi:nucleoside-diphosphate-sugar epimerase